MPNPGSRRENCQSLTGVLGESCCSSWRGPRYPNGSPSRCGATSPRGRSCPRPFRMFSPFPVAAIVCVPCRAPLPEHRKVLPAQSLPPPRQNRHALPAGAPSAETIGGFDRQAMSGSDPTSPHTAPECILSGSGLGVEKNDDACSNNCLTCTSTPQRLGGAWLRTKDQVSL